MAISLIAGLLKETLKPEQILVAEPDADRRKQLEAQFSVNTTAQNADCLHSDTVVLAVKPQVLQQVCRELTASTQTTDCLFISIAAGINSDDINRWLGNDRAIVRCMPNTPALVGLGATALYANNTVNEQQQHTAELIMQAMGISIWVTNEDELDAVTAVSGSGPAYFFLLMEAMQAAGTALGLSADTAKQLTIQTALGAANMADKSDVDPSILRERVTSKGGTTEQAIMTFNDADFHKLVKDALQAAYDRSISMSKELGKDT